MEITIIPSYRILFMFNPVLFSFLGCFCFNSKFCLYFNKYVHRHRVAFRNSTLILSYYNGYAVGNPFWFLNRNSYDHNVLLRQQSCLEINTWLDKIISKIRIIGKLHQKFKIVKRRHLIYWVLFKRSCNLFALCL